MTIGSGKFAESCLRAVEQHHTDVIRRLWCVEYQAGGLLPSELVAFASVALAQGANRILESGRGHGFSTETFCQWSKWILRSCDVKRNLPRDDFLLDEYPNAIIATGDSCHALPRWVLDLKDAYRMAVLIDGPKGVPAWDLGETLSPHVVFYAIHDVTDRSPIWEAVPDLNACEMFWTRNDKWLERWKELDERAWKAGGYSSRREMTADSFGLLILPGGQWRDV